MLLNTFEMLDYRLQDVLYQKPEVTSPDIVIIGIDDDSLEVLGRWPWPRDYHGRLIEIISEGEPAAIGYDVIFAEQSSSEDDDEYLIRMVAKTKNIIFPVFGNFNMTTRRGTLKANSLSRPFAALNNVSSTGHINTILDNDGIVRKTILNFEHESEKINSFSWKLYKLYESRFGNDKLEMAQIPMDSWQRTHIRFSGKPHKFELIPFYQIINGDVPGEYFRDKIVLVGPTAVGMVDDYYFTPMAPQVQMYGVEIHANIIQQFMNKKFWKEINFFGQLLIMLALAAIAYFVLRIFKPQVGVAVLGGLILIFLIGLKIFSIQKSGYIISFIYPIALIIVQYVVILGEKFILEQLEKKRVTDVFGKYVAPQVVGKILEEGEEGLQLGGVRRDITVLFVDIRGFTPLSEAAEAEEVVSILNEYLTLCAESIFTYGGTLDKYIGDATMALFNAPLDLDNHQIRAVQTAWAMHKGAQPLQKKLEKRFGKTVRFGVGIHTGSAIVGNIGADFRMDYTAIGDTVNTAARIESNSLPGQILISQEVYHKVKDYVEVTDLGIYQMKGKTQGIQIYQVDNLMEDEIIDKVLKTKELTNAVNDEKVDNVIESQKNDSLLETEEVELVKNIE